VGVLNRWHWLLVGAAAVILFGAYRLPELARALGRSLRVFRAERRGIRTDGGTTVLDGTVLPPGGAARTPGRAGPAPSGAPAAPGGAAQAPGRSSRWSGTEPAQEAGNEPRPGSVPEGLNGDPRQPRANRDR
jgi:sec-independent protein translocase protein TatA